MLVIIWQALRASDLAQCQPKHESRFDFSSWWRDALNVLITPVWSYASGTSQDWSHRVKGLNDQNHISENCIGSVIYFLFWLQSHSFTWRGQGLWPVLQQPDTRGQSKSPQLQFAWHVRHTRSTHIYGAKMSMMFTWSSRIRSANVGSHAIVFKSLHFVPFTLKRNTGVFKLKWGLQRFQKSQFLRVKNIGVV